MESPRYEYSRSKITDRINYLKDLKAPFGLVVRYAVKANSHPDILSLVHESGLHFDASSSYEAAHLLRQGIAGERISLSSQQSAHNLEELIEAGVLFIATSLKQARDFIALPHHPKTFGVRINPAIGGGHNNRTSTGGINASFGIWHEYAQEVRHVAASAGVLIDRLHVHIGSGTVPSMWGDVMDRALDIVEDFKDVVSLNIGGGYKVHRYGTEPEADLIAIMDVFSTKLRSFQDRTGRELRLEIEPGSYLIASAGTLVAQIDDIVDTGEKGYTFLRLNTGMNDFLRSTLYGAQHRIAVLNDSTVHKDYIVVGHNCEASDIFTTAHGNPELMEVRQLNEARIGDVVHVYDVGAYCGSMRAKGYNSFPDAIEVMVD